MEAGIANAVSSGIWSSSAYAFGRNLKAQALYTGGNLGRGPIGGGSDDGCNLILLDLSRSNSIYGNSTSVTPSSLTCTFLIRY